MTVWKFLYFLHRNKCEFDPNNIFFQNLQVGTMDCHIDE